MRWISLYQELLTGIVFGFCTWEDLKYKGIQKKMIGWYALAATAGKIVNCFCGIFRKTAFFHGAVFFYETDIFGEITEVLLGIGLGMLPGVFCLLLGLLTKQSLGYGDGFLLIVSGISLGLEAVMGIVMYAFFLCGGVSMLLLIFGKGKRKQEIPFVPFLFAGWVMHWI